jgi:hypothetical protein
MKGWDKFWSDKLGDDEKNPFEINIEVWKALNTLDSRTVGVSRNDWNKVNAIWNKCGVRM